MKTSFIVLLSTFTFSIWAETCGTVSHTEPLEQAFEEKVPFSLSVENGNGPIKVVESQTGKVEIRATTKHSDKFDVEITGFGTPEAKIKVVYPETKPVNEVIVIGPGQAPPPSRSVDLQFAIPPALLKNLSLKAGNGTLWVSGSFQNEFASERKLSAITSHASVRVKGLIASGQASIETSNGSVTLDGVQGSATVSTANQSIHVKNGTGSLKLYSSNGTIHVDGQKGKRVDAFTTNAPVIFNSPDVEQESATTANAEVQYTVKGSAN